MRGPPEPEEGEGGHGPGPPESGEGEGGAWARWAWLKRIWPSQWTFS